MDYLKQFNTTIVELVDDLIRSFPSDGDFRMYKLAIQGALIADDGLVHGVFREKVCSKYSEKILARDESFFLNNSYDEMKSEYSQAEQLINKLKTNWSALTPDHREVVWKYMRLLVLLDRKIGA